MDTLEKAFRLRYVNNVKHVALRKDIDLRDFEKTPDTVVFYEDQENEGGYYAETHKAELEKDKNPSSACYATKEGSKYVFSNDPYNRPCNWKNLELDTRMGIPGDVD